MVYNIQNHWLSGLHPSFGILNTKKKKKTMFQKMNLLAYPSSPHPKETLCFLVFRIPDDGQSPETQ
jgi:hypothetical protein